MKRLMNIEGIGPVYAKKLNEVGIHDQHQLLEQCATPQGRHQVSVNSHISQHLLLKWANRADLARIKGISEEYADLLEAAGVDTVPELASRNPVHLCAKLSAANDLEHRVRRLPTSSKIATWIEQAKTLPQILLYG